MRTRLNRALGILAALGMTLSFLALPATPVSAAHDPGVEILEPVTDQVIDEGEYFDVVAAIYAGDTAPLGDGWKDGTVVTATLSALSGAGGVDLPTDLDETIDYVPKGNAYKVSWEVECEDKDVQPELQVELDDGTNTYTDTVKLWQREGHPILDVTTLHTDLPKDYHGTETDKAYWSQTFSVIAKVKNKGGEVAEDVYATLKYEGDVELVDGEVAKKYLSDIDEDEVVEVHWTVHCKGTDDAYFNVLAEGKDDLTGKTISDKKYPSTTYRES